MRDSFRESLKKALKGEKTVIIRIAHVGENKKRRSSIKNNKCYFIPITHYSREYEEIKYLNNENKHSLKADKESNKYYHADPLIYAQKNEEDKITLSLTYGENDIETILSWIIIPEKIEIDPNTIDAYVFFNTTFVINNDYKYHIQLIHGGFKVDAYDYIRNFKYYFENNNNIFYNTNKIDKEKMKKRVELNPHWIAEHQNNGGGILMMVGDEYKWFFGVPIAPHILYPNVYPKPEKLEKRKKYIKSFLKNKIEVEKYINEFEINYETESILKDYLNNYIKGEKYNLPLPNLSSIISRKEMACKILNKYCFVPQIKSKDHKYNFSYLDIILNKNCLNKYSFSFAMFLYILLDSFLINITTSRLEDFI